MRIGEVVNKTGMSKDTIRFYEKKGLITVGRSESEWNNYKEYTHEVLRHLLLIKKAKGFGFTLNEIAELLDLMKQDKASCQVLSGKIKGKLVEIDEKIRELQTLRKMISDNNAGVGGVCQSEGMDVNCETVKNYEL